MRTRVGRSVVLVATLFSLPAATQAAEGRIPLFEPGPITASGKYVLTRDIAGAGAAAAISVQAPQVEIDLNGFTVTNTLVTRCIQVLSSGARLTVRNGTLANCQNAVFASTAAEVVVEDVTVNNPSGVAINMNNVRAIAIRRVTVLGFAGAGSDGIGINSPSPFFQTAVVEDCTVNGVLGRGIVFNRGTVHIRNNRVTAAGTTGIWVLEAFGSEISGNLVVGSASDAGISIFGTHGSTISGNVVRDSSSHGIWLTGDSFNNVVRGNVSTGNGLSTSSSHGLYVQGILNTIEGNTLNYNGGAGLYFDTTGCRNRFGRNIAVGNDGIGVGACSALFPPESCSLCAGSPNVSFGDNLIPGPPVF